MNKNLRGCLTIAAYLVIGVVVFILMYPALGYFGWSLFMLIAVLLWKSPEFLPWLNNQKGFSKRLAKWPGLATEKRSTFAIMAAIYLLPLSTLFWIIQVGTTDNATSALVDIVIGIIGVFLFIGWGVLGWGSKVQSIEEGILDQGEQLHFRQVVKPLTQGAGGIIRILLIVIFPLVTFSMAQISPSSDDLAQESSTEDSDIADTDKESDDMGEIASELTKTPISPTSTSIPSQTFTASPSPTKTLTNTPVPPETQTAIAVEATRTKAALNATATQEKYDAERTATREAYNAERTKVAQEATSTRQAYNAERTRVAMATYAQATEIASYDAINWQELVTYADSHIGEDVWVRGRVFNINSTTELQMWIAGTYEALYVVMDEPFSKLYENDVITVYGTIAGENCGTNAYGAEVCQPLLLDAFYTR